MKKFLTALFVLSLSIPAVAGDWYIETVDSTGSVGLFTSLALESSGYPHISYFDNTNSDLKYTRWNGSAWQIETVDSTGSVGRHTSLALDSSGNPHISYFDNTNDDLKYAHWNGSDWQIERVDSTGDVGYYTSLALNSSGYPHISYFKWSTVNDLKYARWDGSAWQIEIVDWAGSVGSYTSLALDTTDNPHISYYDNTNDNLKYARWNGSAWQIETVDSAGDVGHYTSLVLDSSGHPHISYYDGTNGDLKYARWDGAAWQIETVDLAGGSGYSTSLTLDSSGYPHISYHNTTNNNLKYARWDGFYWQIETVDSDGYTGQYTSLALDSSDNPHISYYDFGSRDLKYAYGEIDVDLSAEDIAISTRPINSGPVHTLDTETLYVGAIIKNNSAQGCSNYEVEFKINDEFIGIVPVGPIQGGESKWVYVEWNNVPSSLTPFTVSAMVDPDNHYPDDPDDNNYAEADYAYYYADNGTDPFNHDPDTYGQFYNDGEYIFGFDDFIDDWETLFYESGWSNFEKALYDLSGLSWFYVGENLTDLILFSRGICFGMSATCSGYYTGDLSKPDPADVFDYSFETAENNIKLEQVKQYGYAIDLIYQTIGGREIPGSNARDAIRDIIGVNDRPAIINMSLVGGMIGSTGHSVIVYKVLERDDKIMAYTYDPNQYIGDNVPFVICYDENDWYLDNNTASGYMPIWDDPSSDPTSDTYSDIFGFPYLLPDAGTEDDTEIICVDVFERYDYDFQEKAADLLSLTIRMLKNDNYHLLFSDNCATTGVEDEYSNRFGYILGVFYDEIPGAYYLELDEVECLLIPDDRDYSIYLDSNAQSELTFNLLEHLTGLDARFANWHATPFTVTTKATIDFSQDRDGFVMEVDYDGDGEVDEYVDPDYEDDVTDAYDVSLYSSIHDEGILLSWAITGDVPASVCVLRELNGVITPLHNDPLPGSSTRYVDRKISTGIEYRYWLEVTEADGTVERFGPTEAVLIEPEGNTLTLNVPYPSPAKDIVTISYTLPNNCSVELCVYDLSGRRVATLVDAELTVGRHEVSWNCADVESGVYLYRLETGAGSLTQRLVVSR